MAKPSNNTYVSWLGETLLTDMKPVGAWYITKPRIVVSQSKIAFQRKQSTLIKSCDQLKNNLKLLKKTQLPSKLAFCDFSPFTRTRSCLWCPCLCIQWRRLAVSAVYQCTTHNNATFSCGGIFLTEKGIWSIVYSSFYIHPMPNYRNHLHTVITGWKILTLLEHNFLWKWKCHDVRVDDRELLVRITDLIQKWGIRIFNRVLLQYFVCNYPFNDKLIKLIELPRLNLKQFRCKISEESHFQL